MKEQRVDDRTTVLVTGATGTTGSRVASRLTKLGHTVRAASRRATAPGTVRFDWYDAATHDSALGEADRVYLVPPIGDPDPAAVMVPFLERAREAGVRRVVLLSSSAIPAGGPVTGQVHGMLPELFGETGEWAVLRPSWFMQNMTGEHPHAQSIRAEGVVMTATGTGRVGFVDADDIAAVAVHALTDAVVPGHDLVITGPQALGYDDLASVLTEVGGRPVVHRPLTHERMRAYLAQTIPEEFASGLADLDRSISEGAEDRVTDTVERITGRAPRTFRAFAERALG